VLVRVVRGKNSSPLPTPYSPFPQYAILSIKEIIEVMMKGKSNKEIAETVLISIRTVGNYLQSVYQKTGVPNRFALYSLIKEGLPPPEYKRQNPTPQTDANK
jgi:DNA-binding CsgD family transcriptional regulator